MSINLEVYEIKIDLEMYNWFSVDFGWMLMFDMHWLLDGWKLIN